VPCDNGRLWQQESALDKQDHKRRPASLTSFDLNKHCKDTNCRRLTRISRKSLPRMLEDCVSSSPEFKPEFRTERAPVGSLFDSSECGDTESHSRAKLQEPKFVSEDGSVGDPSSATCRRSSCITICGDRELSLKANTVSCEGHGVAASKSSSIPPSLHASKEQPKKKAQKDPRLRAALFEQVAQELFDLDSSKAERKLLARLRELREREGKASESGIAKDVSQEVPQTPSNGNSSSQSSVSYPVESKKEASKFANLLRKVSSFQHAGHDQRRQSNWNTLNADGSKTSLSLSDNNLLSPWRKRFCDAEQTAEDVRLERRIEAVFSSFALFGRWDPNGVVVPQEPCKLGFHNFILMCRDAKLIRNDLISARRLHTIFKKRMDKATGLITFKQFLSMLPEIADEVEKKTETVMEMVLNLNREGHLWIHSLN